MGYRPGAGSTGKPATRASARYPTRTILVDGTAKAAETQAAARAVFICYPQEAATSPPFGALRIPTGLRVSINNRIFTDESPPLLHGRRGLSGKLNVEAVLKV